MEIDQTILNNTTNCNKNFCCLNDKQQCLCEIDHCVEDRVLFVKCDNNVRCHYKISFGNSYICNCPTRHEIFIKYGM